MMKWGQLLLGGQDQLGNGSGLSPTVRERRQNEGQLAERRTTKHRLEARKSRVADAKSYRIASHQSKRWLRAIAQ